MGVKCLELFKKTIDVITDISYTKKACILTNVFEPLRDSFKLSKIFHMLKEALEQFFERRSLLLKV